MQFPTSDSVHSQIRDPVYLNVRFGVREQDFQDSANRRVAFSRYQLGLTVQEDNWNTIRADPKPGDSHGMRRQLPATSKNTQH
ncbi:hypothetical protein FXW78_29260 [Rhodococcus opacus]|nr:hypothetical protein [Rhodococcus opacus]